MSSEFELKWMQDYLNARIPSEINNSLQVYHDAGMLMALDLKWDDAAEIAYIWWEIERCQ